MACMICDITVRDTKSAFISKIELLQFASDYYEWRERKKTGEDRKLRLRFLIHLTGLYSDQKLISEVCDSIPDERIDTKEEFVEIVKKYAEKCNYYRRFLTVSQDTGEIVMGQLPDAIHEYLAHRIEGSSSIDSCKAMMTVLGEPTTLPR